MKKHDPDEHPDEHLEPLVRIGDPNEARLLAARLRSEGIPVRVHGESSGPYPVTVGGLADVEIWVTSDRLDEARAVVSHFLS